MVIFLHSEPKQIQIKCSDFDIYGIYFLHFTGWSVKNCIFYLQATLVDMGNFIQLMADDETLEYLEEGFKKLQVVLFTCLYFYLFI